MEIEKNKKSNPKRIGKKATFKAEKSETTMFITHGSWRRVWKHVIAYYSPPSIQIFFFFSLRELCKSECSGSGYINWADLLV